MKTKLVRAVFSQNCETLVDEHGRVYSFLGAGHRYGLDAPLAVQPLDSPAQSLGCTLMPWPWRDGEARIDLGIS
jgi:hypothetical protein